VLLVETGNVSHSSPVLQLTLDHGPHTTMQETVLASEIAG